MRRQSRRTDRRSTSSAGGSPSNFDLSGSLEAEAPAELLKKKADLDEQLRRLP
jgi:hypothetical protein